MYQLLVAFLIVTMTAWSANSQEKNCPEIRSCIQKDLDDLILKASHESQKDYLQKLNEFQKKFEANYLSKSSGYNEQVNLAYATSLLELLTAPNVEFMKLQKSLNAQNCIQSVQLMRESTRSFFKDALSEKAKYHYDSDAWKSFEALLSKICELK